MRNMHWYFVRGHNKLSPWMQCLLDISTAEKEPNPLLASHSHKLVVLVHNRIDKKGGDTHLTDATALARSATWHGEATPRELPAYLNTFANLLIQRYARDHHFSNLLEAGEACDRAVKLCQEHQLPSQHVAVLSLSLADLHLQAYKRTKNQASLQQSIDLSRAARRLAQDEGTSTTATVNLAITLAFTVAAADDHSAWDEFSTIRSSLANAKLDTISRLMLDVACTAADLRGPKVDSVVPRITNEETGPIQTKRHISHAVCFMADHTPASLENAVKHLKIATSSQDGLSHDRIQAARLLVRAAKELGKPREALPEVVEALDLAPGLAQAHLNTWDLRDSLASINGLAAEVCSLFLEDSRDPALALAKLELGRTVSLQQLMRQKYGGSAIPGGKASLSKDSVSSLCNFLSEPDDSALKDCVASGPAIVVNCTGIRSDAIIVFRNRISMLHLPLLTLESLERQFPNLVCTPTSAGRAQRAEASHFVPSDSPPKTGSHRLSSMPPGLGQPDLSAALEWLWTSCVKLVFDEIRTEDAWVKRIWWIGTGLAGFLPFHAAARHDEPEASKILSSYAPSLRVLWLSRRRAGLRQQQKPAPSPTQRPKLLAVGSAAPELAKAEEECQTIKQAAANFYDVDVHLEPRSAEVSTAIGNSEVVHFACHAISDPSDPYQSCLVMDHGKKDKTSSTEMLTVRDISEVLSQSECQHNLAYLSACSTTAIRSVGHNDDSLHLTAMFQALGFTSVIGSLWPVSDAFSCRVADEFYRALGRRKFNLDEAGIVAESLDEALSLASKGENANVELWAPYVHYGI
jgi:hypothetical protein